METKTRTHAFNARRIDFFHFFGLSILKSQLRIPTDVFTPIVHGLLFPLFFLSCRQVAGGLSNVVLGTASGKMRPQGVDVALAHPLGSCYNFYTWAEQVRHRTE